MGRALPHRYETRSSRRLRPEFGRGKVKGWLADWLVGWPTGRLANSFHQKLSILYTASRLVRDSTSEFLSETVGGGSIIVVVVVIVVRAHLRRFLFRARVRFMLR